MQIQVQNTFVHIAAVRASRPYVVFLYMYIYSCEAHKFKGKPINIYISMMEINVKN